MSPEPCLAGVASALEVKDSRAARYPWPVTSRPIPAEVLDAAHARRLARQVGDWEEADRLRALIEAAGWKVIDRGVDFALRPAHPPDVMTEHAVRYGASERVPTRLDEPAGRLVTVVARATDHPAELARLLDGLRRTAPAGTQVIIVADAPSDAQAAALEDPAGLAATPIAGAPVEVVWMASRAGQAAALNAGIRRAVGGVVVVLDETVELLGGIVSPLVAAFADPSVAVAGGWGSASPDARRFAAAPPGDVDVIDGACLAFRRADYIARGPLDEHFRRPHGLDVWWSLVLRDEGPERPPRRALCLAGLPLARRGLGAGPPVAPDEAREVKRNSYRVSDRFGGRRDLLSGGCRS